MIVNSRRPTIGLLLAGIVLGGVGRAAGFDLTIDAPDALMPYAARVRTFDPRGLEASLAAAGLALPGRVHVSLVDEEDPRARAVPTWVVGEAFGGHDILIFPSRVSADPNDSIESVLRHEIVHLALDARAGGHALPRWFQEGVAETVGSQWGFTGQMRLLGAALSRPAVTDVAALFESDSESQNDEAYLLAAAIVVDVRRRHGPGVPGAIAAHVAEGVPFDLAFTLETGETVDQAAQAAWSVYRRVTEWIPLMASGQVLWMAILLLACAAFVATMYRRARLRRRWDELDDGDG